MVTLARALYPLGMTGIPVYNVNNNCATGSSALFLAHQLVRPEEVLTCSRSAAGWPTVSSPSASRKCRREVWRRRTVTGPTQSR